MNKEEFETCLIRALNRLYKFDKSILDKHLNLNERSVTFRLAIYLHQEFSGFDVDCEYNRMLNQNNDPTEGDYWAKSLNLSIENHISGEDDEAHTVFPDIIIHKRKTPRNLAVIEVKMEWKNHRKAFDLKKLIAYKNDLKYTYAIYLEIGEEKAGIQYL